MPAIDSTRRKAANSKLTSKPRELAKAQQTKADKEKKPQVRRPGPRGWLGRGRGESTVIQPADEWRGTTVQVCGLHPFSVGTGTPMVGVPIGLQLFTGATDLGLLLLVGLCLLRLGQLARLRYLAPGGIDGGH